MNMKLLEVVIPPYLYNFCSTWKTFWEENFTLGKFSPVNMKICGCRNVRKHRENNNSEKYITLDISLQFVSLDKMKIISLDPKEYSGISGKGLIVSLGLKTIVRSKKNKKVRYDITNFSMKDISKMIKEFENMP